MLGAPCSPCCGGCTPEALRAVYDRIRSASCTVSLAGSLPVQESAVRFEPAIGAFSTTPASDAIQAIKARGSWYRWDQFACPDSLPLALASSSFAEPMNPTVETTAQIVFAGNSDPSPQVYRSRLWVYLTVLLRSGDPQGQSTPTEGERLYSVIPGTSSCYMIAFASVFVRAAGMTADGGQLDASAVALGNVMVMGPQNSYPAYAYSIPAPYYHFPNASQSEQVVAISQLGATQGQPVVGEGTAANLPFSEHNAMWDYAREMQFEPGISPPASSNTITGGAQMDIWTDNAVIQDEEGAISFQLASQSQDGFSSYGFGRWFDNTSQLPAWGANLSQPVLVDPNDIQPPHFARFPYQVAAKKYVDTPPAFPLVTSLSVNWS